MSAARACVLAGVLTACGASAESARMDAFQATCLAARGKAYADAVAAFRVAPDRGPDCTTPLTPVSNASDVCPYPGAGGGTPVCQAWWSSRSSDSDLCVGDGCWFGCELRYAQDSGTVCLALFYSGQPCQYGLTGQCN